MFGTTKSFLDYFGLKKLDDLPELADLSDWESLRIQLDLPDVEQDEFDDSRDLPKIHVLHGEPGDGEAGADGLSDTELPDPVEAGRG